MSINKNSFSNLKFIPLNNDVFNLLLQVETHNCLSDMVIAKSVKEKLERVIKEYTRREELRKYGLTNRCKILLYGMPGTGKTMTSMVLAKELNLPFFM